MYVDVSRFLRELVGPNLRSIKGFPEEDWAEARRLFGLVPGEYDYVSIPTLTLTFRMYQDSLS